MINNNNNKLPSFLFLEVGGVAMVVLEKGKRGVNSILLPKSMKVLYTQDVTNKVLYIKFEHLVLKGKDQKVYKMKRPSGLENFLLDLSEGYERITAIERERLLTSKAKRLKLPPSKGSEGYYTYINGLLSEAERLLEPLVLFLGKEG